MDAVCVIWLDATSGNTGWHLSAEADEFAKAEERPCITYGFLVDKSESWVTVAQTGTEGAYNNLFKIYAPMIQEIIYLPDLDSLRSLQGGKKPPKRKK